jgi:hypothetical protein
MAASDSLKHRRRLKIVFWCLSPLFFLAFLRLFWMFFHFIYGTALRFILGEAYARAIGIAALLTAVGFACAVVAWLYGQYKKHIVDAL